MQSIRFFLTLTIIAVIILVNFLSSLRGYRESMIEAESLFNDQLLEYALLINSLLPAQSERTGTVGELPGRVRVPEFASPSFQSNTVFQVFEDDQQLLYAFNTTRTEPIMPLHAGYGDTNFNGYRWHALVYFDLELRRWIITAQRDDIRYSLAERVVLESVLPTILGIPIAGFLVWVLIGIGLRPVTRLSRQIEDKEAADLSPLANTDLPRELEPLQQSTNELLNRLKASFDREKRFAADAAHELRTPISILKVQIHNILGELAEPGESVQQLKLGVDRMGHLVEQILALYKTAPDLYAANFETVNLHDLASEAISQGFGQFEAKSQTIELRGDAGAIDGDRFALLTLLDNLLSNAAKYTQAGGRIEVSLGREEGRAVIAVCDNGPGIPASEYDRVLERFHRLGGDRHDSREPGCGLGLAIVKHIVDLHRARMTLSQNPAGQGLCVTIQFADRPDKKP